MRTDSGAPSEREPCCAFSQTFHVWLPSACACGAMFRMFKQPLSFPFFAFHLREFSLMPRRALNFLLAIALALSFSSFGLQTSAQRNGTSRQMTRAAAHVPAPEDALGFRPGDDRKL